MDPVEKARLTQQHQYISTGLGFALHPTIERELSQKNGDLAIANVSEEYHLPGSDDEGGASSLRYPRPVHLSFGDVGSGGGTLREHQGRFDVVAVRLLHTSLTSEAWDATFRNLISLLRPGGWLQWTDFDPLTPRIAAINPAASDVALRDLFMRYVDCLKAKKLGTTYRISNSMRNCGLEDEDSDMYPLVPELEFTRNVTTGVVNFLQQSGDFDHAQAAEVQSKIDEEIEIGKPLLWYDLWCHIARKP